MKHPIPDAALDDRLGFVGTAGSGKTYNASASVERLLDTKARIVVVDPLDVWWGLRLIADGSGPSRYAMPIFGGAHGDLPLNEHAGALIGETVAGMAESCIVSLGGLATKAAERRFMLAFLDAIYRKANGEPVHIIFDEADLWAPQKSSEPMLQSRMEEICRRGRVKGLIPWLITQRPAVISKDVLSQVDGLIAFKLTSSQDRDALEGWIEGQADRQQWKEIRAALPTLAQGEGVAWLPGRGVLETVKFPTKRTFDSSRTPKRGEKKRAAALNPLDLDALKGRLATVEADTKANDPKLLKAEIARLTKAMSVSAPSNEAAKIITPDPAAIEAAEKRGYERALRAITPCVDFYGKIGRDTLSSLRVVANDAAKAVEHHEAMVLSAPKIPEFQPGPLARGTPGMTSAPRVTTPAARAPRATLSPAAGGGGTLTPALQKVINAIAWWRKIGREPIEKARACVVAGYSPRASTFGVYLAELAQRGLVTTPIAGKVQLTAEGIALADVSTAATADELRQMARGLLAAQEAKVFDVIYESYPDEIRRDAVAEAVGLSPTASTTGVYISAVAAFGIIEASSRGHVRAADWLFP